MIVFAAVLALAAAAAAPGVGAASGKLTANGKTVSLTHAIAFDAGARIHLLVTDQALPPDEVGSQFELETYLFRHKVSGLEVTLDAEHKVIEVGYRSHPSGEPCADCFAATVAGGPDGPLTGSIKATAKGEAAKMKVDVAFNAPFAKPSTAASPTP
jgi:hypothetical protein